MLSPFKQVAAFLRHASLDADTGSDAPCGKRREGKREPLPLGPSNPPQGPQHLEPGPPSPRPQVQRSPSPRLILVLRTLPLPQLVPAGT